jgi:hypothetical protein
MTSPRAASVGGFGAARAAFVPILTLHEVRRPLRAF